RNEEGEDELQDDAPDESRGADAEQRHQPGNMVADAAAEMGGGDPERYSGENHDGAGNDDQLQSRRQELGDVGGDRPVGVERAAEVAVQEVADEIAVLD